MANDDQDSLQRQISALQARVETLERAVQAGGAGGKGRSPQRTTSFVQPHRPSVESRIGSQFFNRVGIVALLVGVALFLKYAVDQRWLGPGARVATGLAAGLALVAWSERFRRRGFPVFSFSLKAAGTGVLYLALWASFALFHLVPFPIALLGMVLITAGNAWLCWVQNSEVLAAYALTGGFLTPVLLEPAHASVWVLGGYLVLLDAGLFSLLLARRWPRLLPAAFTGTICYLLSWGFGAATLRAQHQSGAALVLSVLFFLAFSITPLLLAPVGGRRERWLVSATAVANATLGMLAMYLLLPSPKWQAQWLFCGASAWFGLLLFSTRFNQSARAFNAAHSALCIGLAAATQWAAMHYGEAALGWALEAAILLWLSGRVERTHGGDAGNAVLSSPWASGLLLGASGVLLLVASALHLVGHPSHMFLNVRFALFLAVVSVCIYGVVTAAQHHSGRLAVEIAGRAPEAAWWSGMGINCSLLATVLLMAAGYFEIHTYGSATGTPWNRSVEVAQRFGVSAWAGALGLGLLIAGFRIRWAFLRWQALALLTLAIAKVFLLDARALTQGFRILSFLGLGVLLLGVSFIYQRDLLNLRGREHGEE